MSERHTPGPWEVADHSAGYVIIRRDWPLGRSVGTVHDELDARLIAAAPDLLEALIAARPLVDVTHPRAAEVHRLVEDALVKATDA